MAQTTYTYSIAGDTSDGTALGSCLKGQIEASSIVEVVVRVDTDGDVLDVVMFDALSGPDQTTLDGLVTAHSETDCPEGLFGEKFSFVLNGAVTGVYADNHHDLAFGERKTHHGVSTLSDGEILGFSVAYDEVITAGEIECFVLVNTVAQSAAGQETALDSATPTSAAVNFTAPIAYVAGDLIGGFIDAHSTLVPDKASFTMTIYCRDT